MIKFSSFLTIVLCILYCNGVHSKIFDNHCDQEGNREVISCTGYVECEGGQYVTKYCRSGEKFDLEQKTCALIGVFLKGCENCNFYGKKPVKGSRSKYMYCDRGSLIIGDCDEYFDRLSKECKLKSNYHSVKNNYYISNSIELESDSLCVPNKRMSIEGSCRSYMECDSTSKWVRRECSESQNFEPTSMKCVWAWKYYCAPSTSTVSPSTSEPTTSPTRPEPTATVTSSDEPITSTVTSEGPTTGTVTSEGPTTGTVTSEVPTTGTVTSEGPTTGTVTSEGPTTGTVTSEGPTTGTVTSEGPTTGTVTSEGPTTGTVTSEGPTTGTSTSEKPTSTTDIPTTVTSEKPTSTGTTAKSSTSQGSTTTLPTTTPPSTPTTTQPPECTKEGEKKVFKKGDCKDYLECDSGKWVKKSCSFGYDFDVNKLKCTWSWWAHC